MKLIVGLGNPGRKYVGTRHNIGFEVIAELARRHAAGQRPKAKFDGEWVETNWNGEKLCLLSPLTFMNLSGRCVRQVMDFYKIALDDLLVVCDDLNLPVARMRFRPNGSAGGQNGLDNIIAQLGTQSFSRLRIGIGRPPPEWNSTGYVLGKFDKSELPEIEQAVLQSVQGVEYWIAEGIQAAMNRFNSTSETTTKKQKRNSQEADSESAPKRSGESTKNENGDPGAPPETN